MQFTALQRMLIAGLQSPDATPRIRDLAADLTVQWIRHKQEGRRYNLPDCAESFWASDLTAGYESLDDYDSRRRAIMGTPLYMAPEQIRVGL